MMTVGDAATDTLTDACQTATAYHDMETCRVCKQARERVLCSTVNIKGSKRVTSIVDP